MSDHTGLVELRMIVPDDLDIIYQIQNDPKANDLAKVYARERSDFDAHWAKILESPDVIMRAIAYNGQTVGNINSFPIDGKTYIGYWIERPFWGKGIATRAVQMLLETDTTRPMHAIVATGNIGSCIVLEKNGFVKTGESDSPGTDRFAPCVEAYYCLSPLENPS